MRYKNALIPLHLSLNKAVDGFSFNDYAKEKDVHVSVRGLRAITDFEYELQLAFANQYLDDNIEMAFLMTRASHAFISSSTVKEIAMHHGPIDELAPKCVCQALKEKFSEK